LRMRFDGISERMYWNKGENGFEKDGAEGYVV
jgi:hypothetical protein